MSIIGQVESLWRYPVKSMRGESRQKLFAGFSGIYGDRLFAFRSSAAPSGFPFLTGRECDQMLLYCPRFRDPQKAAMPSNQAEAEAISPGLNPLPANSDELALDIETPAGEVLAIDHPDLTRQLRAAAGQDHALTLLHSDRAMTDCRPISLFSLQTAKQLGDEVGTALDKRRFRANVYLDLAGAEGFSENSLVGRRVRIGSKVVVSVLERDPRCKMITLDPDTALQSPEVLRKVAQSHDGMAGVYGAILVEGTLRVGDPVEVLD